MHHRGIKTKIIEFQKMEAMKEKIEEKTQIKTQIFYKWYK